VIVIIMQCTLVYFLWHTCQYHSSPDHLYKSVSCWWRCSWAA